MKNFPPSLPQAILVSLSSNKKIGSSIAQRAGLRYIELVRREFADSEMLITTPISFQKKKVFFFHQFTAPIAISVLEFLLSLQTIFASHPHSVSLILPYLPFGRQDQMFNSTQSINSGLIPKLAVGLGPIHSLLTFDSHNPHSWSLPNTSVANLSIMGILLQNALQNRWDNYVLVAPDAGCFRRFRAIFDLFSTQPVIIHKIRPTPNQSSIVSISGEVKNKNVILIDDMIDTGGTICQTAQALKQKGAQKVVLLAVHGLFSGFAIFNLQKSLARKEFDEIWISDSCPLSKDKFFHSSFVHIISLAPFISEWIQASEKETPYSINLDQLKELINAKK